MKHAVVQNWVVRSEATDVAKPRITDEKIPEALDDEVVQTLFDLLPTYSMYIMSLLLETGLRLSELFNLRWCDVDTTGEAPSLTVVKSKSKRFRIVPLTDAAIRMFDHLRAGSVFDKMDSPTRFGNGYAKLTGAQRSQLITDIGNLSCTCLGVDSRLVGQRQYCSACKELVSQYDITYAHAKKHTFTIELGELNIHPSEYRRTRIHCIRTPSYPAFAESAVDTPDAMPPPFGCNGGLFACAATAVFVP